MERKDQQFDKLNQLTCLMLGKIAHIEDVIDVATIQATALLADIGKFQE
ncbi:MAG TPA: hypothetical protein VMQ52_04080 [Candidatus Saccharimonadales bacterium]|jgi:hypothetical protein|nr:hypothetical protein [Candidatus Saccharimonadales bacterium]